MSDISKLTIEGIEYDIKDETARADIEAIREELMGTSAMADEILDVLDGISSEDKIEAIIDNSGVLDNTDGTVEEKVEQLVELSTEEKMWIELTESKTDASSFFTNITMEKLPKTNFINATNFYHCFANTNIERIDYYINSCNGINFTDAFMGCKAKTIKGINVENATNIKDMFRQSSIVTIEEPLNVTNATYIGALFWSTNAIVNIRFVENTIHCSLVMAHASKLSNESIQSIIDGLATVETAQTLTLHTSVKAKLTQTQLDTITSKNWNLA